jgi:hypothetical protein
MRLRLLRQRTPHPYALAPRAWPIAALLLLSAALVAGCGAVENDPVAVREASLDSRADWMGVMSGVLAPRALREVALPGTHDSGTAAIHFDSELTLDSPDWMRALDRMPLFGNGFGFVIANWSRAQGNTIDQQLEAGVRYLDLRVCVTSRGLRICHGMAADPVESVIDSVRRFLDAHSTEIVILDFNHFYGLSPADHAYLNNRILTTFGSLLAPRTLTPSATVGQCWQSRYQAIVLYADWPSVNAHVELWAPDQIVSPWANTTNVNTLQQWVHDRALSRPNGTFFVSQGILTPDQNMIRRSFIPFNRNPRSLYDVANSVDPSLNGWIRDPALQSNLNIVIGDWVSDSLIGTVESLNAR